MVKKICHLLTCAEIDKYSFDLLDKYLYISIKHAYIFGYCSRLCWVNKDRILI